MNRLGFDQPGGARFSPFSPQPATANQQVIANGVRVVYGWSVYETTGMAAAVIRLRDGTSAAGPELVIISLAPGESTRDFMPLEAVALSSGGIYLEVVAGSVEGVVYWG